MEKIKITKEDREEFKKTKNGALKKAWCLVGGVIDFIATIAVCFLIMFSSHLTPFVFYIVLYALLVIVVLGGEMIGTYFGALEQFMLHKKEKKEISFEE